MVDRVIEEARSYLREPMRRVAVRARVTRPWWRRRFHAFGANSILHRPDWVYGPHQVSIGEAVIILHGLWLAVERPAHTREPPVLRIGDRVGIRPYCTISASESIVIEDDVTISAFTTVIDSDHTYAAGRPNVMHNPVVTAPVRIGRGSWIGERVAVLRGSNIGEQCIIGSNSVVRGEVPDHSIAVGSPARVVGSTRDAFAGS